MTRATKAKAKLTNSYIRQLRPPASVDRVWDSDVPGFGLRVRGTTEASRWSWIYVYRHKAARKQITLTLGAFLEKTPDEARRAAKDAASKANTSDDLWDAQLTRRAEAAEERKNPTGQDLWDEYWRAEGRMRRWAPRAQELWRLKLGPTFARTKVRDISPQDVERFKAAFSNHPVTTNRSLAVLSRMMTLAVKWGYRAGCSPEHPVKGVLRYPEPPRERYFTEKELGLILDAIDSLRSRRAVLAFHMLCETGARSGEVMNAHWGQFDWLDDRLIWTVASTGTKTARPIARALSPELANRLDIWKPLSLGLQPNDNDPKWLFPKYRDPREPIDSLHKAWDVIKKRANLRHTDRIHDLRHTVATMLLRRGVPLANVGDYLGHSTPLTTRRYAHVVIDRQTELNDMMSGAIRKIRSGEKAGQRSPEATAPSPTLSATGGQTLCGAWSSATGKSPIPSKIPSAKKV
jgi:integrase